MKRDEAPSREPGGGDGAETVRAEYEWESTRPSIAVIETAAIAANSEPDALPPLGGEIDTDALDVLFRGRYGDGPGSRIRLSFSYAGFAVTVEGSGDVSVQPTDR